MEDAAHELGVILANANIRLVYGGGGIGMMGVLARSTMAAGGEVVGIIPHNIARIEVVLEDVTELHVVSSMHERKQMMFERSDAFVGLPGGIGTLDEVVEILLWRQIGLHDKPLVLVNIDNFWTPFRDMIRHQAEAGFGAAADLNMFSIVSEVGAILPEFDKLREPTVDANPSLI